MLRRLLVQPPQRIRWLQPTVAQRIPMRVIHSQRVQQLAVRPPSSGNTVANSAPTASSVTITDVRGGGVVVGKHCLVATPSTVVDGVSVGASTCQWLRDGSPIAGATAST